MCRVGLGDRLRVGDRETTLLGGILYLIYQSRGETMIWCTDTEQDK